MQSPMQIMSDPDRTHYREIMQDYFSVSDSEPAPSELSEVVGSPSRRADFSHEWILGGQGPDSQFFNQLRQFSLGNAETRPLVLQADLAQRLALDNAIRCLEIPDKRALDEAFMAENDEGAVGGPPGDIL